MMWLVRVLSPCVKYVDVILPLALPGLLTYGVPEDDAARVGAGMRVVVPLRGKRLHTAVVRRVHSERPEHSTEAYLTLLDNVPLISETTLRFWDWVSGHYCCGPGEVALAALPSGMRLASETKLELSPDAEELNEDALDDRGFQVVEALRLRGGLSFKEVGAMLGLVNPAPVLHKLVEQGWVIVDGGNEGGPAAQSGLHGAFVRAGDRRRSVVVRCLGHLGCAGPIPIPGHDGAAV